MEFALAPDKRKKAHEMDWMALVGNMKNRVVTLLDDMANLYNAFSSAAGQQRHSRAVAPQSIRALYSQGEPLKFLLSSPFNLL